MGIEALAAGSRGELSIAELTQRASISPGLLYRYFPDKRAFHQALLAELADQVAAAGRWPEGGFAEALRASLEQRIGFAERQPGLWRALYGRSSPGLDRLREQQIEEVLRRAGAGPVSRRTAIQLRGWLGFCEAAVEAWLDQRDPPRRELANLLADALDPHLAAPGASRPCRPRTTHKPRIRLVAPAPHGNR